MNRPEATHPIVAERPPASQGGVALIVVLIMLAVIGLVSAATMRRATTADQVTHNTRLENLAKQAAHAALRWCEGQVQAATPAAGFNVQAANAAARSWEAFANWRGAGAIATGVTYNDLGGNKQPQCLAEFSSADPAGNLVIVTSRGFSPDYTEDAQGNLTSGAVVWLQSFLYLTPAGGTGTGTGTGAGAPAPSTTTTTTTSTTTGAGA